MIQETFDCLLTRAFFINNEENEILAAIDSKASFIFLIRRVSALMQQEDFFLINPEYQHKLSTVIGEYRFKYSDPSIIEDINYIIGRLNEFKAMSEERKNYLINEFYKDQYAIRNLPLAYRNRHNINLFMVLDFVCLTQLFPGIGESEAARQEEHPKDIEVLNDVEFISLMNILLNKHSDIFFLDGFIETTVGNFNELLESGKLSFHTAMYIKKTLKNIKRLERGKYKVVTI